MSGERESELQVKHAKVYGIRANILTKNALHRRCIAARRMD